MAENKQTVFTEVSASALAEHAGIAISTIYYKVKNGTLKQITMSNGRAGFNLEECLEILGGDKAPAPKKQPAKKAVRRVKKANNVRIKASAEPEPETEETIGEGLEAPQKLVQLALVCKVKGEHVLERELLWLAVAAADLIPS